MQNLITHPIFTKSLVTGSIIHGLSHWQKVEKFGLMIADNNGADKKIISLFAYLHDARREHDFDDINHGRRAAQLLDELIDAGLVELNNLQYEQLRIALSCHNLDNASSKDITIQTCWDADRLDLWRDGIIPNPAFMFTDFGKSEEMIEFARELNCKLT